MCVAPVVATHANVGCVAAVFCQVQHVQLILPFSSHDLFSIQIPPVNASSCCRYWCNISISYYHQSNYQCQAYNCTKSLVMRISIALYATNSYTI